VFMELATPTFNTARRMYDPTVCLSIFEIPTGSFFDAVDRVSSRNGVFLRSGFTAGAIGVCSGVALRPWLRAPVLKAHKKALLVWPWLVLTVFCACRSRHRPSSGESGHVAYVRSAG